jgi:hypothetical protein
MNLSAQYLVSCNYVSSTPAVILNVLTGLTLEYNVETYKMIYNTVDVNGQPIIASGAFIIPSTNNCDEFPIAVYSHGTSLKKTDVPSSVTQETLIGQAFSGGGYFACMPDYIGMGESPGLHPYIHAESEATSAIDMVRAAREFISDSLGMIDNGEVFLTGYSQGGHACMATNKYIQDNNLELEFNVIASAPCSGPYALSITMADTITSLMPYSNPGYITYMLASYQLVYGNIFNSWSEILQSPFDTIVPPFFNGSNTTLDMGMLNALLPSVVDSLIQDSVLTNFVNDSVNKNHPLWLALLDNDNYDWNPLNPVNMYYCTADEQVAYENALLADSVMNENGASDVQSINSGSGLNHGGCVLPALTSTFNWFQTLKTPCSSGVGISTSIKQFSLYPNPSSDILKLSLNDEAEVKIYSAMGRLFYNRTISAQENIKVEQWAKGLYLVEIKQGNFVNKEYFLKN